VLRVVDESRQLRNAAGLLHVHMRLRVRQQSCACAAARAIAPASDVACKCRRVSLLLFVQIALLTSRSPRCPSRTVRVDVTDHDDMTAMNAPQVQRQPISGVPYGLSGAERSSHADDGVAEREVQHWRTSATA
jgi:hypothetical protein